MNAKPCMHRLSILGVMILGLPALAAAQHGGMAAGHAGGFAGHGGAVVMRAAPSIRAAPGVRSGAATRVARGQGSSALRVVGGRTRSNTNRFNNGFNNFNNFGEFSSNDVPGLGFDFAHLAAISGGRRRFGFFGGTGFFDGGFLFGSPSVIIEQAPAPEAPAQAEDAIAGDAAEPPRNYLRLRDNYRPPEPVAQSAPEPPVEQYVFVRRDGGLLYAVGYSWDKDTLRYITADGIRRTIGRDALDLSATEQKNEERGLNFHAPA